MDVVGAVIWRIIGPVSPSLRARALWARASGDGCSRIVDAVVRRGDVAVDVGANTGLFTDRLARLVGARGAVYAFEPNPRCAGDLRRIAAARGNVSLVTAAASGRAGTARLAVPSDAGSPNDAMGSLEERAGDSVGERFDVATTTLDVQLEDVAGVRFVKCDVEGHEHEVLLGGLELLRRDHPVLLLELEQRHRRRPLSETFALLGELGYHGLMLTGAGPRPLTEFDLERDQLSAIGEDPATQHPPPNYVNNFVFTVNGEFAGVG